MIKSGKSLQIDAIKGTIDALDMQWDQRKHNVFFHFYLSN